MDAASAAMDSRSNCCRGWRTLGTISSIRALVSTDPVDRPVSRIDCFDLSREPGLNASASDRSSTALARLGGELAGRASFGACSPRRRWLRCGTSDTNRRICLASASPRPISATYHNIHGILWRVELLDHDLLFRLGTSGGSIGFDLSRRLRMGCRAFGRFRALLRRPGWLFSGILDQRTESASKPPVCLGHHFLPEITTPPCLDIAKYVDQEPIVIPGQRKAKTRITRRLPTAPRAIATTRCQICGTPGFQSTPKAENRDTVRHRHYTSPSTGCGSEVGARLVFHVKQVTPKSSGELCNHCLAPSLATILTPSGLTALIEGRVQGATQLRLPRSGISTRRRIGPLALSFAIPVLVKGRHLNAPTPCRRCRRKPAGGDWQTASAPIRGRNPVRQLLGPDPQEPNGAVFLRFPSSRLKASAGPDDWPRCAHPGWVLWNAFAVSVVA
jgi:hypothetical protein